MSFACRAVCSHAWTSAVPSAAICGGVNSDNSTARSSEEGGETTLSEAGFKAALQVQSEVRIFVPATIRSSIAPTPPGGMVTNVAAPIANRQPGFRAWNSLWVIPPSTGTMGFSSRTRERLPHRLGETRFESCDTTKEARRTDGWLERPDRDTAGPVRCPARSTQWQSRRAPAHRQARPRRSNLPPHDSEKPVKPVTSFALAATAHDRALVTRV